MKKTGLIFRTFGDPLAVLNEFEAAREHPSKGQLEVRMIATPINPSDITPIRGAYPHHVKPPCVPGYEGVGLVTGAGPGCHDRIGKRVLPVGASGTWQSHVIVDADRAITVPDGLPDGVAARSYINPLAALLLLKSNPVEGCRVILTAGNSSCARILAQWATRAGAEQIISVTEAVSESAGICDYGVSNIQTEELRIDSAVDTVVFDAVGGPLGDRIASELGRSSAFVSYGLLSGTPMRNYSVKARYKRFHLRDWAKPASPEKLGVWFDEVFSRMGTTVLPDTADYSVEDWKKALKHFQMRGRTRKPMLTYQC